MKYSEELIIALPRERVVALFDNPDNLPKWQKDLISFEHLDGNPGHPGARSKLKYKMGRGTLAMVETIVRRELPERFDGTYEADGVHNLIENRLVETPEGQTHWTLTSTFTADSFWMKVMTVAMPWMFKRQTRTYMEDFKKFAEAGG